MTTQQSQALPFPQARTCPYHPPAGYRDVRQTGPVGQVRLYDGRLVWLVTGHAQARALLTDPRLSADRQNPRFPVIAPRLAELIRRVRSPLLGVDEPEHGVQRRMLIPSFTVKRTAALRPRIQRVVDEALDAMVAQGPPADLVASFALPVPSTVICLLLGVPYADHEFFEGRSRQLLRGPRAEDVESARQDLNGYLRDLVRARRSRPGDGLLDELVAEQLEPGHLTEDELVSMALLLLVAGHETTANMISLGTLTLLEHPEQLAAVRTDPGVIPDTVEELLRFLSIADGMARVATADIEVAGVTIRAGDGVFLATSEINRDPGAFPEPDALDVRRGARHHVAFGFGVHQCLGQNLARAELEIALTTLFTRLPGLRTTVPAEELPVRAGDVIQGLDVLPVTW
nr:cytochrome P450 [Streptomyces sp. SID5468]